MAFSSRKMDSLKGQQFMKKNESVVDADTAFQAIPCRRFVSGQKKKIFLPRYLKY